MREYSFARALAYLANPSDKTARAASTVEIEASQKLGDAYGGAGRGLIVPGYALTREQSTQTEAQGSALVGHAPGGFAGALRAALVTGQAGATVLTDLRSDVSIPTIIQGAAAHWLDEDFAGGADVTNSTPETGRGVIAPQTVAASVPVSRRLMQQGEPGVAALIAADLLAALGHEIDAAALGASSDANAPEGLRQSLAASKVTFAGGIPTWVELLDMEQDVLDANATDPAFILAPVMARALKEAETVTGSGRHIMAGGEIADRKALTTSAMPADELFVGGFSDLIICMWGGVDLRLDVGAGAASDTRILRAFVDVGFLTRRKSSFAFGGAT